MIEAREGPNGARVYRARVYYRGRYVASRTFPRKRDAQEWERKQVDTLKTGIWADPKAGEKPVREWCDAWLAAQPAKQPATERNSRCHQQADRALLRPSTPGVGATIGGPGMGCRDLAQAVTGHSAARTRGAPSCIRLCAQGWGGTPQPRYRHPVAESPGE
jgi:hypothetical protein